MQAQASSALYDANTRAAPPLRTQAPAIDRGLGKGWFDLKPLEMNDNLRRDLKIIQMRNYLDPKRFYKNPDKLRGKILHTGTVIEGKGEYKSSRLTRKERRQSIVGEVLADQQIQNYTKRKYAEIQAVKSDKIRFGGKRKKLRRN